METKALIPSFGRRGLFAPLANLREEMDKLFNEWVHGVEEPLRLFEGEEGVAYLPRVNVVEREKFLEVTAELPGIEPKEVELELTKGALLIKGEKKLEKEEKGEGYMRRERRFGAFHREVLLPWEVDVPKVAVEAVFKNGILTVKVPKPAGVMAVTRKIAINA
jgi:HSP20 family protein